MATHVIRVERSQVAALIRAKQNAVREAVWRAAIESANETLPKVRRDSPVDQAIYKNSWEVVQGAAGGRTLAELRNDATYAGVIELGARPFYPPLQPLIEWVERKFGDLTGMKRYRGRASLSKANRARALQIARAIQRKIGQRGLPPRRVMGRNIPFLRRAFQRAYEKRLAEIAASR